ncbi:hypothetical protein [Histidinibacterium lentulum]|uniref:Uncharacterized protein n=1 Tax=Histidinibacterium lentulum TaxID=2480588 RepID=A0A3N2QV73_9RHOB|nr:hypothetical protein [Histidinibacterium lentulum]ROT99070.1 hypothetical protein EAT49_15755 [Histidinibacterium lentulum]
MNEHELDELLTFHWPRVVRRVMGGDADDWCKGFVRSIAHQGKRRNWTPSAKQAALMRRLVAELGRDETTNGEVVEG